MTDDQTKSKQRASPFLPQAIVDAGDVEWTIIGDLVAHRLANLPASAILEVTSLAPAHRIDILNWCREMGHDCFQMSVDGDRTWFWIKKR